jgi:hypothetical protein
MIAMGRARQNGHRQNASLRVATSRFVTVALARRFSHAVHRLESKQGRALAHTPSRLHQSKASRFSRTFYVSHKSQCPSPSQRRQNVLEAVKDLL